MKRISGYWYRDGIEPRAVAAWALAIVSGYLFTTAGTSSSAWFTGVFAHTWLGTNGLGWVITFIIAAGVYAALGGARRTDVPVRPAAGAQEPAR
jgi:cytosine/uracil/thiamine/allantoin permease